MPRTHPVSLGQRFGRWTVVGPERRLGTEGWRAREHGRDCRCDCGTVKLVRLCALTSGHSQSCGCLRAATGKRAIRKARARNRTHGLSKHPLYHTWRAMRRRCESPSDKGWKYYGGRGITVCGAWRDPSAFVAWMEANLGPRPIGASLDRIKADGNYEPGNVRWATSAEQVANRRQSAWLSDRYWETILAALGESDSPEAREARAVLSAQLKPAT